MDNLDIVTLKLGWCYFKS